MWMISKIEHTLKALTNYFINTIGGGFYNASPGTRIFPSDRLTTFKGTAGVLQDNITVCVLHAVFGSNR